MGYFLARTKSRFRGLYFLLVFMPLLVSVVVRSYGWMILLGDEGVINTAWKQLPFAQESLRLQYTPQAVVVGLAQVLLPFMVIPLMSAIQNIDPALEESATSLGAGPFRIFFRLIVPLSVPGLISGTLLVFTTGMSAFAIPQFLGGPSQMCMANLVYQQMLFTFNWPRGSAVGMLMLFTTLIAIVLSLTIANKMVPRGMRVNGGGAE
jgi:putative spermidine/putrescine transport system permease protein